MTTVNTLGHPSRLATPGRLQRVRRWWGRKGNLTVGLSLLTILVILVTSVFAPFFTPYTPTEIDLRNRLAPPALPSEDGPTHLLGTDVSGRDVLSRVLYGARLSLLIGAVAALWGLVVGTLLGLLSGYIGGWVDQVVMYLVDVQLSLPFILLAVAVALVLGSSLVVLIGIAALSTWPHYARVVRGVVLSLREREFIIAAQALGASHWRIMREHMLPNLISPIMVLATLNLGRIILLESGLSFLGIGIRPPTPSWGNMISEGRDFLTNAWWIATMPGLALMLLTMAVAVVGDWLRDLSDIGADV